MSCPDFTINTNDFINKMVEKLKLDNDCQTKMLSYFLNKNIQLDNTSLCVCIWGVCGGSPSDY